MRVSVATLVALGAIAALVALGVTDQVLPASDPRTEQIRPWVAARALGITAYLLLAIEIGSGLLLSHPRNTASWRLTKPVFPWHEMLTVFTGAFVVLHVVILALDPFAKVGTKRLAQSNHGGTFTFTQRGGCDRRYVDILAIRHVFQTLEYIQTHFRFVISVEFELLRE
jgi:hypothetical protein